MFSVFSNETTSFDAIATFHNLPAIFIQSPYKDMPWTLYANHFMRTLRRLLLYAKSLDQQDPDNATLHLRLMSDSDPTTSHLSPISAWLNTGSLPPGPTIPPTPKFTRP